jgi:NAD(P)-dependent dehydrogenase (short-subunit alcohol dehydrogenase family)
MSASLQKRPNYWGQELQSSGTLSTCNIHTLTFEAMFLSAIRLTRLALPDMRARRYGRIMLVVSLGDIQAIPDLALSNALRSAPVGWAKPLASEVAADGVMVNCLAPGRTLVRIPFHSPANLNGGDKPFRN